MRGVDSDLEEIIIICSGINIDDIENVLAQVPGEADGANWHYIVELKNGKYAYLTGGCDYSGWGCQDWGDVKFAETAEKAAALAGGDNEKKTISMQLTDQLTGNQPYGLREE